MKIIASKETNRNMVNIKATGKTDKIAMTAKVNK